MNDEIILDYNINAPKNVYLTLLGISKHHDIELYYDEDDDSPEELPIQKVLNE